MKKIDLHQDIILSFIDDIQGWTDPTKTSNHHGSFAGNQSDCFTSELSLIWAANRPYHIKGELGDIAGRVVTYDKHLLYTYHEKMAELVRMYDIGIITDGSHLQNLKNINIIHHIEGIDDVQSIADITELHEMGIRSIGFIRNYNNTLAHANTTKDGGLTELGKDVVAYMNERGMIIDTAHMNHQSMMDVVHYATKPIINSHSNLKHFCSHTRNIEDSFLIALKENGGVVGLSVYGAFLSDTGKATIDDYLAQIHYIIELIGEDYVALGTDFHGIITDRAIIGLQKIADLNTLEERIISTFGTRVAQKFFRENSMRILRENLL